MVIETKFNVGDKVIVHHEVEEPLPDFPEEWMKNLRGRYYDERRQRINIKVHSFEATIQEINVTTSSFMRNGKDIAIYYQTSPSRCPHCSDNSNCWYEENMELIS